MANRKRMTADELMAQLSNDPDYVGRVAERDRRIEELLRVCAVNNTPHPFLPRMFIGSYERAYPMLVRHLSLPHHPRVREGIIRALTVKDGGSLVSDALFEQFTIEEDPILRWVLANALRTAMPLEERKRHPEIARVLKRKIVL